MTTHYTVHTPTKQRGSWKWQDAIAIYIVECPADEKPDLRRRNHRLVSVFAQKVPADTRMTRARITWAQERANEMNAQRNVNEKPSLAS